MLDNVLNSLRLWHSTTQAIKDTGLTSHYSPTHPGDYSGMKVYQKLESTKPIEPLHSRQSETEWQLPLPYDLMFTIINLMFLDDKLALLNLTKTCRSLANICEPLHYQYVVITSHRQDGVSDSEQFADLLSRSPHIINYVQHLKIQDDIRALIPQGSGPVTAEAESFCYILTRQYPKLSCLHLSLGFVGSFLPIQLQHALSVVFTLPNLHEVMLEHIKISSSLLTHLSKISDLEIRGGVVQCRSIDLEIPNKTCTPEHLVVVDQRTDGFNIKNLFAETSPLRLSKTKHLQIRCRPLRLNLLGKPLQACSTTLTILEVSVSSYGGIPDVLDLRNLPMLSSLTLSADLSTTLYGDAVEEASQRFSWLVKTLGTCHQPSRIENLKFAILTWLFSYTKYLPWSTLDALFAPYPENRWPRLKCFIVQDFNERVDKVQYYKTGMLEAIILPMTPILASTDILRFMIYGE